MNKCLEIHGSAVFRVVLGAPPLRRFCCHCYCCCLLLVKGAKTIKVSIAH